MAVVKLNQFKAFVLSKDVDEVTRFTSAQGLVQYLHYRAADMPGVEGLQATDVADRLARLAALKARASNLARVLGLELAPDFSAKPVQTDVAKVFDYEKRIEHIERNAARVDKRISSLKKDIDKYTNIRHKLDLLHHVEVDLGSAARLELVEIDYGRLSSVNYERMTQVFADKNILWHVLKRDKDYVYVMVFRFAACRETIARMYDSLYFEVYDLPESLLGAPEERSAQIERKLKVMEIELAKSRLEKEEYRIIHQDELQAMYTDIAANCLIKEFQKQFGRTEKVVLFSGWIPRRAEDAFRQGLEDRTGGKVLFFSQPAEEYHRRTGKKAVVPTLLANPRAFRPFEQIVRMYSIPSYFEFDPTTVVGVSFVLMFGLMFGDVGQGAVIFLLSWLMGRKWPQLKDASLVGRYLAGAAMFFGAMYGEYFGFHFHHLPALWLVPMDSTDFFLPFTVVLGVLFMSLGLAINIFNKIKTRDRGGLLLDKAGLAGILFYWGTLLVGIFAFFHVIDLGRTGLTATLIVVVWLVPLLLMFFREPLEELLHRQPPVIHGSKFDFFTASAAELLDTVLSYLGNTISFVRLAAFALNHAGLFAVFTILAGMLHVSRIDTVVDALIFILGNIFVIVVEGFIVLIQVMRLEFYEFFSKFFVGGGVDYQASRLAEEK